MKKEAMTLYAGLISTQMILKSYYFNSISIHFICCRDQILIAMQKCGVWLQISWMILVDYFTLHLFIEVCVTIFCMKIFSDV